jgi:predicted signal transduction protein with EAL and GGDEF domain
MARLSDEIYIQAIQNHNGNVTRAANELGITRQAVYDRARQSARVQIALDDARENMLDEAESALLKAVKSGEGWAVCFALKTVGKSRGYVERTEHKIMDVSKLSDDELRAIVES